MTSGVLDLQESGVSGVRDLHVFWVHTSVPTTSDFAQLESVTQIVRYADDTTLICAPIYKGSSNIHIIREHNNIMEWSEGMCLDVNHQKCQSLRIPENEKYEKLS